MEQRSRCGLRSAKELGEVLVIGTPSQTRPVWPIVFRPCDPWANFQGRRLLVSRVMCAALLVSLAAADRHLSVVGTVRDDPRPALTLILGSNGRGSRALVPSVCPKDVLQGHQVNTLTVGRHCHCSQRGLWRVKYLRVFMAVWLSIFPDHIWLVRTLPSLRKELGRSLR